MRAVSTGTPEVNSYPFTTRGMALGHMFHPETNARYQVTRRGSYLVRGGGGEGVCLVKGSLVDRPRPSRDRQETRKGGRRCLFFMRPVAVCAMRCPVQDGTRAEFFLVVCTFSVGSYLTFRTFGPQTIHKGEGVADSSWHEPSAHIQGRDPSVWQPGGPAYWYK